MSKWEKIDLDNVPSGHYVAFADDLTPIAHGPGKRHTTETAWALGCHHPLVIPALQLKELGAPEYSCHDS